MVSDKSNSLKFKLELLLVLKNKKALSLKEVLFILGEHSHNLFLILICVPFLQPIPLPGLSTPLGLVIFVVSFFLAFHKKPILPKFFENLTLSTSTLTIVVKFILKADQFISRFSKERIYFLQRHIFHLLNMFCSATCALLLALPLPIPFSNALPAWCIFFIALGYIKLDGLLQLLGYATYLATLVYFMFIAFLGDQLWLYLKNQFDFVKSYFYFLNI